MANKEELINFINDAVIRNKGHILLTRTIDYSIWKIDDLTISNHKIKYVVNGDINENNINYIIEPFLESICKEIESNHLI